MNGRIVVVSAPSGSGKGTIIGKFITLCKEKHNNAGPGVSSSVSYTSRSPRRGESEGVHYYFVTKNIFQYMIANDEFVEWDLYQGDYYGTSKEKTEHIIKSGADIVFDITINGAYAIRRHFQNAVLVYLLPPSFEELERRLRARGTETEDKIIGRLTEARKEIMSIDKFDYYIINTDVSEAADRLYSILTAEKCRIQSADKQTLIDQIVHDKLDARR